MIQKNPHSSIFICKHRRAYLRNILSRHVGLIVENATEVVAVWKNLSLIRQISTAAINQINTRQPIFPGDLLSSQMLFDRDWVVCAALDRGIIRNDHTFLATKVGKQFSQNLFRNGIPEKNLTATHVN